MAWPQTCARIPALPPDGLASGRADRVSGGDALMRVTPAALVDAARIAMAVNQVAVNAVFRSGGHQALVGLATGLREGANDLAVWQTDAAGVEVPGTRSTLKVTNHPSLGPIFSGPQEAPFFCQKRAHRALHRASGDGPGRLPDRHPARPHRRRRRSLCGLEPAPRLHLRRRLFGRHVLPRLHAWRGARPRHPVARLRGRIGIAQRLPQQLQRRAVGRDDADGEGALHRGLRTGEVHDRLGRLRRCRAADHHGRQLPRHPRQHRAAPELSRSGADRPSS